MKGFKINKNRPRLQIFKSNKYTHVQLIDDAVSKTLLGISTKKVFQTQLKKDNIKEFGLIIANMIKDLSIEKITFDKGNCSYLGNIAFLADEIRSHGVIF